MWLFPLGAAIVSGLFAVLVGLQWLRRRRASQAAWAVALLMFAIASLAAAIGIVSGWTHWWYRVYYLFGAIVNVPVLALGTIYLLAPRWLAHAALAVVVVASIFAAGGVVLADVNQAALATEQIPPGSEVMPDDVRTLSRYYSFAGFFVVVGGALWSAWRLSRQRDEQVRPLVAANVLIATGTFVVAVASAFARYGQGAIFAVGLLVGVSLMFAGFVRALPRPTPPGS